MKGNSVSVQKNHTNLGTSISNSVLISLIVILSVLVAFLFYSLFIKISRMTNHKDQLAQSTASAIIHIEVLNGCGVDGIAAKFTNYLREKNFDVVNVSNYKSSSIEQTMVIDRTGNVANVEKLADVLGVEKKNIIQQISTDYLLDATVVIGRDYFKLNPFN